MSEILNGPSISKNDKPKKLIFMLHGYGDNAANFMHLNSEKEMIYWTLIITVLFLIVLLFIPILWDLNNMSHHTNHLLWDDNCSISGGVEY